MKKVMVSVGLGLATMSQANAWTGGVEDMRTMQANSEGSVVRVKAKRVQCCRLQPVQAHGHAHQEKMIHNGQTYYCTDVSNTMKKRHVWQPRKAIHQHHSPRPAQRVHHHNQQQALQAQRAKRQAMYAAQAKRKALLLAQQRKRAAMLEQQKRRKIQLAQQQQRAAQQAAMQAAKKKRAALLLQKKRRALQLAQQQRQQAQKRAMLLAQQKQRAAQQRRMAQVQTSVNRRQQVVTQQIVPQQAAPEEVVISRRIITTYVQPSQRVAPPVRIVRPRMSPKQRGMQQSVDHHDRHHSRAAWQQPVQAVTVAPPVRHHRSAVVVPKPVAQHEARVRQQRLQQIRTAQIAAQQKRQHQTTVKMAPMAPYTAPAYMASKSVKNHQNGWQRSAAVNTHSTRSSYGIYQG